MRGRIIGRLVDHRGSALPWPRLVVLTIVLVGGGGYVLRNRDQIEFVITMVTTIGSVLAVAGRAVWQLAYPDDTAATDVEEVIAAAQRRQWRAEVTRRALTGRRLPVTWRLADDLDLESLDDPVDPGLGPPPVPGLPEGVRLVPEGGMDELFELYRRSSRGRLVIQGGAGAGKTSVLMLLLLRALELAPRRPVPVLLHLADWSADRAPLVTFATGSLARDIPALRAPENMALVEQAMESGRICFFLDGFDQLAPADQDRVIACVNEIPNVRVVIATRPEEYDRARSGAEDLLGAVAVELLPVGPAEALNYLRRSGDDETWRAVVDRFTGAEASTGPPLDNPLYLSLLALNYRDASPAELLRTDLFPTRLSVADHLIGGVVPQAYRGRGRWDAEQAQHWLRFIARRMTHERDGTGALQTQLAWSKIGVWPPAWLQRLVYGTYVGFTVTGTTWLALHGSASGPSPLPGWVPVVWGLVAAAGYVLAVVLDLVLTGEWTVGVAIGLAGGLGLGLTGGLLLALELAARTGQVTVSSLAGLVVGALAGLVLALGMVVLGFRNEATRSRRRWPSSLSFGRPSGFVSVILVLFAGMFLIGLESPSVADWGLVGACFLVVVLAQSMTSGQASEHATSSARRSLRRDVAAWAAVGLLLGGCGALVWGIAFDTRPAYLPLWFAIYFSVAVLSSHTSGYLLAVGWFWMRGNLPLTPLRFLDDARDREVMRTVGWHYEFKHQVLLERLARLP